MKTSKIYISPPPTPHPPTPQTYSKHPPNIPKTIPEHPPNIPGTPRSIPKTSPSNSSSSPKHPNISKHPPNIANSCRVRLRSKCLALYIVHVLRIQDLLHYTSHIALTPITLCNKHRTFASRSSCLASIIASFTRIQDCVHQKPHACFNSKHLASSIASKHSH